MVPSPYSEQAPEVKFLFTEPSLCGRLVLDFLFVKGLVKSLEGYTGINRFRLIYQDWSK